MNEKFTILRSTCVPLPLENVDTDQIIPARFLKATTKEGFGDNLFYDWRYDKQGQPIPSFVLNNPGLEPRACRMGHRWLWLPGRRLQLLCRHP